MGLTPELRRWNERIEKLALECGLSFFPVEFELVDWDTLAMVAAYGGFPRRYPHWRHGMAYDELQKSYRYGLSKIYELVINTDPVVAYLLTANPLADHKLVMAHVYGHADFFRNNAWYAGTNRKMLDEMANHASSVSRYADRYGLEAVEGFLDIAFSLDNLIDPYSVHVRRPRHAPEPVVTHRPLVKPHLERYVHGPAPTPPDENEIRHEPIPARPERDVLAFLMEHAPLKDWQRDVLGMVREEAYYFAPQGMTKIMNEGWACVRGDTLVFTDSGLIPMVEVLERGHCSVYDGERQQQVYDRNVIADHETVTLHTRRGLELCASNNHRVLMADGHTWRRMDELEVGAHITVSGGGNVWPSSEVELNWAAPRRMSLTDVANQARVSLSTVLRHQAGRLGRSAAALEVALATDRSAENQSLPQAVNKRAHVGLPRRVGVELGAFLGYLVGDGHISRVKRNLGLTTGDNEQAAEFSRLTKSLFDLEPSLKWDPSSPNGRWRVLLHSETVSEFLVEALGLTSGPSARDKRVPEAVLRSPEPVVRAFLRAYFDCDGYAGREGVILSTASDTLSQQVQLLLLNYGILNRRRRQADGCWHVSVKGASAARFAERIGFGLARKQAALDAYVADRHWYKTEAWDDEVVSLEHGRSDVYDISVTETHRYAAAGLINHNSYHHSQMMTRHLAGPDEIVHYADVNAGVMGGGAGLNPYKLGLLLWRDIEERWDRGRHGPEYEACDDLETRRRWDTGERGAGREKIFEVRAHYNDVMFIDAFLTRDFCERHRLFTYELDGNEDQFEVASREFREVKRKLLGQLTNSGQPIIRVTNANLENKGELLLEHASEEEDLDLAKAKLTLEGLYKVWTRPVRIATALDGTPRVLRYDGGVHQLLRGEG